MYSHRLFKIVVVTTINLQCGTAASECKRPYLDCWRQTVIARAQGLLMDTVSDKQRLLQPSNRLLDQQILLEIKGDK